MFEYATLDADRSDDERTIRKSAGEFVQEEIAPDIADHWIEGTFPEDAIPELGKIGCYAPTLEGHGSPTVGELAYGLLVQELEARDSGLRSIQFTHVARSPLDPVGPTRRVVRCSSVDQRPARELSQSR